MKKKYYIEPEIDVTKFYLEDIITVSGGSDGDEDNGDGGEMGGGIVLPDDEW